MTEAFLHYIWQFQYFDKTSLRTTTGEALSVYSAGFRNSHSGPDFFQGRVLVDEMEWIGSIEIHIFSSGWTHHRHNNDPAYDNVVLHVVWKNDARVLRNDGTEMPTLELRLRINEALLAQYGKLMYNPDVIPCAGMLSNVRRIVKLDMLERAATERLEMKSLGVLKLLARNNNDWEETVYQMLMKNFGFMVNGDPFLQLAQALPYRTLLKHADKQEQIEALLFGQAGFLGEDVPGDVYYLLLRREYKILASKYKLSTRRIRKAQWRFLRLRPANFPTLRIAQFAALLYARRHFFSILTQTPTANALRRFFRVDQSSYWKTHYHFFKAQRSSVSQLGEASIDNLIINSVVPLLVAVGKSRCDDMYVERAIAILQAMTAESNMITRQWKELGITVESAFESQAVVQMQKGYCVRRRCLDCKIGASIVNPTSA